MAGSTDATRPGEAAAVEAVRRVLFETRAYVSVTAFAADLIAAAYPIIAAAVREQVVQDIRGSSRRPDGDPRLWDQYERAYSKATDDAADIAQGTRA